MVLVLRGTATAAAPPAEKRGAATWWLILHPFSHAVLGAAGAQRVAGDAERA